MRQMIWIENARMETWACSSCGWTFSPSGPPIGSDLEEMLQNFERQRDSEHASHVCAEYPRPASTRDDSEFLRPRDARPCNMNPGNRVGRNDLRRTG